jgi:hypothetical protein
MTYLANVKDYRNDHLIVVADVRQKARRLDAMQSIGQQQQQQQQHQQQQQQQQQQLQQQHKQQQQKRQQRQPNISY